MLREDQRIPGRVQKPRLPLKKPLISESYSKTNDKLYSYKSIFFDRMSEQLQEDNFEEFIFLTAMLKKIDFPAEELESKFTDQINIFFNNQVSETIQQAEDNEISMEMYLKIYSNFEFGISETEFAFYEESIKKEENAPVKDIELRELSKFESIAFKKGSFTWICKKINEKTRKLLSKAYLSYIEIFGDNSGFDRIVSGLLENVEIYLNERLKFNSTKIDPGLFSVGTSALKNIFEDLSESLTTRATAKNKVFFNKFLLSNIEDQLISFCEEFKSKTENQEFSEEMHSSTVNSLFERFKGIILKSVKLLKNIEVAGKEAKPSRDEHFRFFFLSLVSAVSVLSGASENINLSRNNDFSLVFGEEVYFNREDEKAKKNLIARTVDFSTFVPFFISIGIFKRLNKERNTVLSAIFKANNYLVLF